MQVFGFFVQWIDLGSKKPLHLTHSGYQEKFGMVLCISIYPVWKIPKLKLNIFLEGPLYCTHYTQHFILYTLYGTIILDLDLWVTRIVWSIAKLYIITYSANAVYYLNTNKHLPKMWGIVFMHPVQPREVSLDGVLFSGIFRLLPGYYRVSCLRLLWTLHI